MTKLLLVLVALSAYASANAAELPRYQALDIGTLGGKNSFGQAINEAGQVTGSADTADGETHAFLYTDGRMIDLGTFGGTESSGLDINEAGQVTGFARTANGLAHVFLFTDGNMVNLGEVPGARTHFGKAINASGEIVGDASGSFNNHAFLYKNGVMSDLGTFGGTSSEAQDINDAGDVLIAADTVGNASRRRAFVYRDGTVLDLGSLGGDVSRGTDINESGQVAGGSRPAGGGFFTSHAFLYTDGTMIDLGTLGGDSSGAWALNDVGEVVGSSITEDGENHAFLYSQGLMLDLGAMLSEVFSVAADINNQGQVTGFACCTDADRGVFEAFVYSDGEARNVNELVAGVFPRPARPLDVLIRGVAGHQVMNDRGQIIALADFFNDQQAVIKRSHAVLLTPISLLYEQLIDKVVGAALNESLLNKVRESFSHYSGSRKPGTCSKLQTFIQRVGSLHATSIPAAVKRDLLASARAIRQAVGCS